MKRFMAAVVCLGSLACGLPNSDQHLGSALQSGDGGSCTLQGPAPITVTRGTTTTFAVYLSGDRGAYELTATTPSDFTAAVMPNSLFSGGTAVVALAASDTA